MKIPFGKIAIGFVFMLGIFAFYYFELNRWANLESLKTLISQLQSNTDANPLFMLGSAFVIYVIATAFSLPGAVFITLAIGAIFGLLWGIVIVSFASTIGATLAFLMARYVFQDSVQRKFDKRLNAINKGIEKDGAFYLFTLRLVPLFPFFLINLLMGLTRIRVWTFYWVSQVGMLAGTAVYVNAGTQLAKLDSLSGILSPELMFSFSLVGVFPLLAKWFISRIRHRKVYKPFRKPRKFDRNLIVIGAGAGGLVSTYIATAVKAKVTLVEASLMGGDCLNYGCVPSKAIIKSAKIAHHIRNASNYGLTNIDPTFSFKSVIQRVHNVIKEIEPHDSVERYTNLGADVVQGYAKILDPWTVEIETLDGGIQKLTTQNIVIATGAAPTVPNIPGLESINYQTSDTLWTWLLEQETLPTKVAIMGGGPIACELAQALSRLGSEVSIFIRGKRVLPKEDKDVAEFIAKKFNHEGILLLTEANILRCEDNQVFYERGGQENSLSCDMLLLAVGRTARTRGFGLEELGIKTDITVQANEYLETLYPNIFAVGDVVGPYQFTHVAAHQAWYAAVNALFGKFKRFKVDYRVIPWVTFVDPQIARVGLSEEEAIRSDIEYEVTRYDLGDLDRAIAESANEGFVKVLTPPGKDTILGATIVSENAGEMLSEFVLAMKHGLGLNKILGTIHVYPTWSEANKYAAGEWKRNHAPEKILEWLERFHSWRLG